MLNSVFSSICAMSVQRGLLGIPTLEPDDGTGPFSHTYKGHVYDGVRGSSYHYLGGFCMQKTKVREYHQEHMAGGQAYGAG